jgi:Cys-rich protein (TIGR01571 family)
MKSYEYPRVRPPTSLQPPQLPVENRFSWMDASGEQEDRVGATRTTSTPAPQEVHHPPTPPQEQVPAQMTQTMEGYAYGGGVVPYQIQDTTVTQPQYTQAPQYYGAYTAQPHPTAPPPPISPPQFQPPQHPIPPLPQPPEPVKQHAIPDHEPAGPIVPDTNPLTPNSPKRPNRTSTNMAIVPPSSTDPAQFSAGSFTPSPQSIKGGSWQHGFCSCAEPSICVTGLFCPCIIYGKTQYRLALRGEKKDPTNMLGYTAVNGSCIAFGVLCGINGILAAIQHTRLRKTYDMNSEAGNVAGDCIKGVCCCCCVVAQDEKEVKFREEHVRKPAGSGAKREGYVAPTSMAFAPPPS